MNKYYMNFATKKILILSILALLLTGFMAGFSWWWEEEKGKELTREMQSIRDQSRMESEYRKLQKEWKEVSSLHERLSALVIEGDGDTIELLSYLDSIAESNGVALTTGDLGIRETEEDENFDNLVVSITLRGGQASVLEVVKILETLPYASSVERLTFIRSGSDATASLTLQVSIKE